MILYIILLFYNEYFNESFYIEDIKKTIPIDRTQIYGKISLEPIYFQSSDDILKNMKNPINNSIINMSNPSIQYEDKTIELNRYSDILL